MQSISGQIQIQWMGRIIHTSKHAFDFRDQSRVYPPAVAMSIKPFKTAVAKAGDHCLNATCNVTGVKQG